MKGARLAGASSDTLARRRSTTCWDTSHLQPHVSTGYTSAYEPGDTTDATDGTR